MEQELASARNTHSRAVQTVPFLSLPAEIRLRIYRFLFIKGYDGRDNFDSSGDSEVLMPAPYVVKHNRDMSSQASNDEPHLRGWRRSSQVLRCCRTLALEGRPVLYGENTFYVDAPSAISFFVRQMTSNSANIWIHHITLSDSWTRHLKSSKPYHVHEIQTLHALKTLRINMLIRPDICFWPPRSDEYSFKALFNPKAQGTIAEIQQRLGGLFISALLTRSKSVTVFVDASGPEYCGEQATFYVARYVLSHQDADDPGYQLSLIMLHNEKGLCLLQKHIEHLHTSIPLSIPVSQPALTGPSFDA